MIAVIFEVTPTEEGRPLYFDIAQDLKSSLAHIDGFVSVERFQSLSNPNTFLSLSFWKSEAAVKQWREHFAHQAAQEKGKKELFSYYRIRVCNVFRDYSNENEQGRPASTPTEQSARK